MVTWAWAAPCCLCKVSVLLIRGCEWACKDRSKTGCSHAQQVPCHSRVALLSLQSNGTAPSPAWAWCAVTGRPVRRCVCFVLPISTLSVDLLPCPKVYRCALKSRMFAHMHSLTHTLTPSCPSDLLLAVSDQGHQFQEGDRGDRASLWCVCVSVQVCGACV